MIGSTQPYSDEHKATIDIALAALRIVLSHMEGDGDYGPEWTKEALAYLQEVENFTHWDEINHP